MNSENKVEEVIRSCFLAYENKDRELVEKCIHEEIAFSSPNDDRIDRKAYFERCWPYSEVVKTITPEKIFVNGEEAFVRYKAVQKDGKMFRNTEFMRIKDNKIIEVEVYFGRTL